MNEHAFQRLSTAQLSPERSNDLAVAWLYAIRSCGDPRVESWYMDRFNRAIAAGSWDKRYASGLRTGFLDGDSPRVREHLRDLATDLALPMGLRGFAGGILFERLEQGERLRQYLALLEAGTLPVHTGWWYASRLMEANSTELVGGVATALRRNPVLAETYAFASIVQEVRLRGTEGQRRQLADAIAAVRGSAALNERDRANLGPYENSLRVGAR